MTKLRVCEMHCERCVARIKKALDAEGLICSVNLEDRTITVDGCPNCVKAVVDILEDLGFSAEVL